MFALWYSLYSLNSIQDGHIRDAYQYEDGFYITGTVLVKILYLTLFYRLCCLNSIITGIAIHFLPSQMGVSWILLKELKDPPINRLSTHCCP